MCTRTRTYSTPGPSPARFKSTERRERVDFFSTAGLDGADSRPVDCIVDLRDKEILEDKLFDFTM